MGAELDEEIRSHLSMAQRDRVDRGESESDASVNARREFGNVLLVKETTRDMWGWTAVENFVRDLRHALRQLKKHLGFTAVAVGTLALGIGSTTAMFSVVKGVLMEPLQYREPSRLFLAYSRFPLLTWQKGPVNARHLANGARDAGRANLSHWLMAWLSRSPDAGSLAACRDYACRQICSVHLALCPP
jgi:hypothetical protein